MSPAGCLRTRPRARLWRAQTPQGFPRAILEQAYQRAARLGRRASDDAALVEAMGVPVRLVPDSTQEPQDHHGRGSRARRAARRGPKVILPFRTDDEVAAAIPQIGPASQRREIAGLSH